MSNIAFNPISHVVDTSLHDLAINVTMAARVVALQKHQKYKITSQIKMIIKPQTDTMSYSNVFFFLKKKP